MECPVCLEVYRVPLLLPGCGHSVCTPCAHNLVTKENFLSCPECRLRYQLRRGVISLPRNIALARTINEAVGEEARSSQKCTEHPGATAALYCHTCSTNICLNCYFGEGEGKQDNREITTITEEIPEVQPVEEDKRINKSPDNKEPKGKAHFGHDVKTSDAVLATEKVLLTDACTAIAGNIAASTAYIEELKETESKMKQALENKLKEVEQQKEQQIALIKKTASKLKYVLKGTVVRDSERLQSLLATTDDRLAVMTEVHTQAREVLKNITRVPIQKLMETRYKLAEFSGTGEDNNNNPALIQHLLGVEQFDPDIESCLLDPSKALAGQSEHPPAPTIEMDESVVSSDSAYFRIRYNPRVRTQTLRLLYSQDGGEGKALWESKDTDELHAGKGHIRISGLHPGVTYRLKALAVNKHGESEESDVVMCRTYDVSPPHITAT